MSNYYTKNKRNYLDYIMLWVKGIIMGTANKVPGVSGGTAALVLNYYEEFIFSLRRINSTAFSLLFHGKMKEFWYYTNMSFLLCILGGTVTSFFSVSLLIDYLMAHYSTQIWAVFFGMVLGSLIYLIKKYDSWRGSTVIAMLAGLFIGISAGMLDYSAGSENLIIIFLCGFVSVCGMTLPGLSGSFLLMIIGNYKLLMVDSVNAVFYTIKGLLIGDYTAWNDPEQITLIKICIIFTLGTLVGVIVFSHILGYLIKHFRPTVIAVIIGFIAGSLSIMWPWKHHLYAQTTTSSGAIKDVIIGFDHYIPSPTEPMTWLVVSFILFGACFIIWVESIGEHKIKIETSNTEKER